MQVSGEEIPAGNPTGRRRKSHPVQMLQCPRCDSLDTKFCYYNNYNLSQPRHFCKNCRRYWTKGGALRNVPVGGGCRKSKRSTKQLPRPPAAAALQPGSGSQSAGANFSGVLPSPELPWKHDQVLLLTNFVDANSHSVGEAGHFPPSEPPPVNWSAADARKGVDVSEMQWKRGSIPGDDVRVAAPLVMEEAEADPALGLWDSLFPYNIDHSGDALFEMQIGDLGCWGGGGW